jgi:hypothetical protein
MQAGDELVRSLASPTWLRRMQAATSSSDHRPIARVRMSDPRATLAR